MRLIDSRDERYEEYRRDVTRLAARMGLSPASCHPLFLWRKWRLYKKYFDQRAYW